MIASLLPGLRELRTPLAAGYLWLVFVYLVAGAPTEVDDAPGPLRDLLTVLPTMGTAATGIAVSFVAYLVGSVSHDVFGQLGHRGLPKLRSLLPTGRDTTTSDLRDMVMVADSWVQQERTKRAGETVFFPISPVVASEALLVINRTLDEMISAGASETERPEARRPMVEAEENLRVAVVPPLVAVMAVLTLTDSMLWSGGLLFAVALVMQAVARQAEARRLADQAYRVRQVSEITTDLKDLAHKLKHGDEYTHRDVDHLERALIRLREVM